MSRRVFDESFKKMALELSYARGSVKEVAEELGIAPGRLSKWRQKPTAPEKATVTLSEEQKEIRRLQKELQAALLERDMDPMLTHVCGSKRRSASGPRARGDIRIYKATSESIPCREDV